MKPSIDFITIVCLLLVGALAAPAANILPDHQPTPSAYLGIRTDDRDREHDGAEGLRIIEVDALGPAGGTLEPDDRLTVYHGQLLFNGAQLEGLLARCAPGDRVDITYRRGDEESTASLTLTAASATSMPLVTPPSPPPAPPLTPGQVEAIVNNIRRDYENTARQEALEAGGLDAFLSDVRRHIAAAGDIPPVDPDAYRAPQSAPQMPPPPYDERHTMVMGGDEASVTVSVRNGRRVLTYRDPHGIVLYEGELDTNEDRRKIPFGAWKMLYELEKTELEMPPERSALR